MHVCVCVAHHKKASLFMYNYFMYILFIFDVYFMYILCKFYVYFIYILCKLYVYFMYILRLFSCTTRCLARVATWLPGRGPWPSTRGWSRLSFRSPHRMASRSPSTPSSRESTNTSRQRQNRPRNVQVRVDFVSKCITLW